MYKLNIKNPTVTGLKQVNYLQLKTQIAKFTSGQLYLELQRLNFMRLTMEITMVPLVFLVMKGNYIKKVAVVVLRSILIILTHFLLVKYPVLLEHTVAAEAAVLILPLTSPKTAMA